MGNDLFAGFGRLALAAPLAMLVGCPDPEEHIAEGIFAERLGDPVGFATEAQRAAFEHGREVAVRRFTPETGLGPSFNLVTCAGCHEKPVTGGSAGRYRDFLLVGQRLPDGSYTPLGVNGIQDQFDTTGRRVASPETANVTAERNPIPFFGVGLLAAIDEEAILAHADPDDADHDGISGRANFDRGFVGRFGRKAQTVSIEGFLRGPLFNHVGVTSNPLPNALKDRLPVPSAAPSEAVFRDGALSIIGAPQAAAPDEPTTDDDGVPDPELSEGDLFDLVSFAMLLAPPAPEPLDETTRVGRAAFERIGCATCHVPTLKGPRGLIPAYSDLLLHDMGPALADGVSMGVATGSEFRTQPLWGIAAVAPYLHDGRADTLDDAIRAHGGEGQASRDAYGALPEAERAALIAFLEGLGGAAEASAGLLPPDAPIPAAGEIGGPDGALDADDEARFRAGRELFDRDMFISEGLGPRFNGDACRSCHFDPVIGGSGPGDVNVIRHGRMIDGAFTAPDFGTITHRHETDGARPPYWSEANEDEQRQTPAIFGLGLIEQVDEAAIVALEDPDDADGDGISGRRQLHGEDLGRFGWKAQVPSLAEFARDASSAELGLSVPAVEGRTFGATDDDDDIADPEISAAELDDLVFYMASLAPPAPRSLDATAEAAGRAVFERVGCGTCHTPALPTIGGGIAAAFSDFLLHDVAPPGYLGIGDGDAQPRELRTPPLWGLGLTAPYMHDGLASTIEMAIARHEAEGDSSRRAVEALGEADRAALLAFLRAL
jgi:CxxC motif-containing protein (DUF1111 family)